MKILFIAADTNKIGGIEKYNKEFMAALRKSGAEVYFVPLRGINLFQKASFVLRIFRRAIWKKPRIICCSHIAFSPICYFIKKLLGIDYTVNVYGIEVANIESKLHKKALGSARFIIKLFDRTAENIVKQIPEAAEKFISLPSFVDGERFYIKEKPKNFVGKFNLKNSKVILTICRLSFSEVDNKGYEKVIRVMPEIIKQIPNAKYLLVGGGDDLERIKSVVRELKLEGNIILPGPAKDEEMIDYYNLADVFILPSKREGFPAIVLLEALACGKPVIGGVYGEKSEKEIFNNKLGYIIDPDDQNELTKSIINILKGKAPKSFFDASSIRKAVLGEYGKNRFEERVGKILELFKSYKLVIVVPHPIQYMVPFFKRLAKHQNISLKVFYCWDFGVQTTFDDQFDREIKWDIPLLEGYDYEFLPNWSPKPSSSFFGQINPSIIKKIIVDRYDVVLVHGYAIFTNWLTFLGAWISGTPIFFRGEAQLLRHRSPVRQFLKNLILRPLFCLFSAFLAVGTKNFEYYRYYGVPKEKIFLVPYVTNEDFFLEKATKKGKCRQMLRKKLNIAEDAVVILYVGKIFGEKGPGAFDLLKAFEKISKNKKAFLVFVGEGKEKLILERYCQEKEIKNAFLVGFKNQKELPGYYSIADILVLPSYTEQWGIVINEAMYFGNVIIASDQVGAAYDLVREDNGFIFPAGSIKVLSEKLKILINDRKLLKKMGDGSRERIKNWDYAACLAGITAALATLKRKID